MTTYIVDAVDSALKLLTYVAEHPNLGVTELASQLGINKSRTYRMLCTLELHRFVAGPAHVHLCARPAGVRDRRGRVAAERARARAHRHMLALNQAINETIVLRVREGLNRCRALRNDACGAHRRRGRQSPANQFRRIGQGAARIRARSGARRLSRATAPKRHADDPAKLAGELDAVARKGYAVSSGEVTPGAVGIAVPVRDLTGRQSRRSA